MERPGDKLSGHLALAEKLDTGPENIDLGLKDGNEAAERILSHML